MRVPDVFGALAGLLADFFAATGALRLVDGLTAFLPADLPGAAAFLATGLRAACLLVVVLLVALFALAFFAGAVLPATFFAAVRVVFAVFATLPAAPIFFAAGFFAIVLRAAGFLLADFFAAFAAGTAFFTAAFFVVVFFVLAVDFLLDFFVAMMSPRKGCAGAPSWSHCGYARQPNHALVCVVASDDTLALDLR